MLNYPICRETAPDRKTDNVAASFAAIAMITKTAMRIVVPAMIVRYKKRCGIPI
jgi:hypothetical protein